MNSKLKKLTSYDIAFLIQVGILVTCILGLCIGLSVYCWNTYGDLPANLVPQWALWFMWGHK